MAIKAATLQVYIYEGLSGSYTDSDLKYTIQKTRIGDDENIVFEIGELVRDYLDQTFNDDYISRTLWVTLVTTLIDESDTIYTYDNPTTTTVLAMDGYGYFEEEINAELTDAVLMTTSTMYIPDGVTGKLPIFAEGVGKVTVGGSDTEITDNGNTNQKIQYIDVPSDSGTVEVYDTDDTTLLKTITVKEVCEPKYTPYKVTFTNKLGAYQDMYFFKKSTETVNITDEVYKRNTVSNSTITYATNIGQQQRYNVNAKQSITLNTGFINEDSNSAVEELLFSDNIWIRYEGKTLPIIPKTKSLTYKTSVNDKLANYTIDFDFAFNKINNVR